MFEGGYKPSEAVLRLKFTSQEGFIDPVAYRINLKPHAKTGTTWKIYPTYDFAHCICDSLEAISISLCSKEFENHRVLYSWILATLNLPKVEQREYSRLKIPYNVTSKSKIKALKNLLDGDDDPRLLTLSALRRRGFPPDVVKEFVLNNLQDIDRLHELARTHYQPLAPRVFMVIDPLECVVQNFEDFFRERGFDENEELHIQIPSLPKYDGALRIVPIDKTIFINKFDFVNSHIKSKHYLTLSSPVILKQMNVVMTIVNVEEDKNGEVVKLNVKLQDITLKGAKGKKVITWVCKPVYARLNIFNNLLTNWELDINVDIKKQINADSWLQRNVLVEPSLIGQARTGNNFTYG